MSKSSSQAVRIEAVVFDTFGTVVDWQSALARALAEALGRGAERDWNGLAREWRGAYLDAVGAVRHGVTPWSRFDDLLAVTLDALLTRHGMRLSAEKRTKLVAAWHTLPPWPEAREGLTALKKSYIIGTLSNGSVRLLTDMARAAGLPWDVIFGGDTFHHYKPDAQTYLGAAALLDVAPSALLMVAAHNGDLLAASSNGLRTAFVQRATEDAAPTQPWDFVAKGIDDLAHQLDEANATAHRAN